MTEETNCLQPATTAPLHGGGGEYLWKYKGPLIHLQKYTSFFHLIGFVENTRRKRFYDPDERNRILWAATGLRIGGTAPFCRNSRFPEDYYANLSIGPVAEALDRLIAALDIPSSKLLSQMNAPDWDTWKNKFDLAMADIRRLCDCTDLDKLADIGIYCRNTFERRFDMQWHE